MQQADSAGDVLVESGRSRLTGNVKRRLKSLLRTNRLFVRVKGKPLFAQPLTHRFSWRPSNCILNRVVRSPNPNVQFRFNYYGFRCFVPMICQFGIQFLLQRKCVRPACPAAFKIQNQQSVMILSSLERQHFCSCLSCAAIAPDMRTNFKLNRADAQRFVPRQSSLERKFSILVSDQDEQVFHVSLQLKIPDANKTPKSGSPFFQSRSAG